ncbi:hypothetical protein VHEMI07168 [[Torrubiella] hemipterigena]|uniref:Alpha/beta hydrolase fold-3 domain-containing protein n=1 Tax=[Torrubiella] hemipterigena TaxID=1531966 RepID=A0A0A1TL49_9HYPO|nr:hypothetical protein VHEMI07168 [[Torrubiella] hemipterigena]
MLTSITNFFNVLHIWFRPTLVALFNPRLSWAIRWRTLLLQPTCLITYSLETIPYLFSRPFQVEHLPVWKDRSVRCLVFKTPSPTTGDKLRPLHIEIHGGAFIGGFPEGMAHFDDKVSRETGAVVVSITYRFAPEKTFPTAIDDVDDTIRWIKKHAADRWGADATLLTMSGVSAGGNLCLASTQQPDCHGASQTAVKAFVGFDSVVDLRLNPNDKPTPEGFPTTNPLAILVPLFDAYAAPARVKHIDDPRLSPILAKRETLPPRMLLTIAGMDILVAEQMELAERVNAEDVKNGQEPRVETMLVPGMMHGYIEIPDMLIPAGVKAKTMDAAIQFLNETHRIHGWTWDA